MFTPLPIYRVGLLLVAAAVITGCASPANPQNMTMRAAEATEFRAQTPEWARAKLAVTQVTGGRETNPAWTSQIGSNEFRLALEESLKSVGMLATGAGAKYELIAHLAKVDQPFMGASMTVTITVNYQLVDKSSRKTVWERGLTTPYTAAWNAAFAGTERLRLANEGAVRTSVTELVKNLQALDAAAVSVR